MCLACISFSGQAYNNFFGFGTHIQPWKEDQEGNIVAVQGEDY